VEVCLGELPYFCFFYPSCNWNTPVDVLQSQCSNRLGKCLFLTVSGLGGMVFARGASLHGSGDDCPFGSTPDASGNRWCLSGTS